MTLLLSFVDMKRLCWLFFFLVFYPSLAPAQSDSLLLELKNVMAVKETFVKAKEEKIKSIKSQLSLTPPDSLNKIFDLTNQLYHEYKVFIYDSAISYSERLSQLAVQMKDPYKREYAKIKTAFTLISSGLFKETFDSLHFINSRFLADSTRVEYYNLMARANYDIGDFDADKFFNKKYYKLANQYLDSGLRLCKPGSYQNLDMTNYRYLMNRQTDEGLVAINILLKQMITDHQKAIGNHHLGLLYLQKHNMAKARDAFIASAIFDLKTATKETAAMTSLADLLYKEGDIENAYLFIHQSMEDAIFYGARQRKIQIGSLLPMIAGDRLNKSESQRQAWLIYSISLTAVSMVILIFVLVTVRQYRKLKEADRKITEANLELQKINQRLRESDKIKEEYIGYYFNINSDYLTKIEALKKSIDQKLLARKFEDLRFVADSLDLKRERENLYHGFDDTFIKLFPEFVTTFNSYFSEENRIILKDNQVLNTELRIFALMRLGIIDTEKIAKILGYSVNTIYAYKTKVKSKSLLPNDEFEAKIREIKTV